MIVIVFATAFLFGNADFFNTVKEQQDMGYTWHKIECREQSGNVPALDLDGRVCYQLLP